MKIILFITFILILYIIISQYSDEFTPFNPYFYLLSSVLLIFLVPILYYRNHKLLALLIFIFYFFSLIVYTLVIIYSIEPYLKGSLYLWNCNMKYIVEKLFTVEIYGKKEYDGPVIYSLLNNHSNSIIDYLAFSFIDCKAKIVVKKGLFPFFKSEFIDINFKKNGYESGNNYDYFIEKCSNELKNGKSIIVFPEGRNARNKKYWYEWKEIKKLQRGCFDLSLKCSIPIIPVIVEKNRSPCFLFTPGILKIHFLKPLDYNNYSSSTEIKNSFKRRMVSKLNKIV